MRIVYFAWIRERIGTAEEDVTLPDEVTDVAGLLDWLHLRGETYRHALQHREAVRVAIDHEHVGHQASLSGAREVALFPPMTGG